VAVNFKYGAEAFALAGIAFGLIKWVGRTLRSRISDAPRTDTRLEALSTHIPAAAADALVRQGIVSAEDLQAMSPREREFLIASARVRASASAEGGSAHRATPAHGAGGVMPGGAAPLGRRAAPTPTRLHLITPSRPPLGVAVHCPGCGVVLDRDALQRFGATTCPRCKRPISAHIQRGRLTVIVEETPEEADHRRRVDGSRP
jgi:hypothetical protein